MEKTMTHYLLILLAFISLEAAASVKLVSFPFNNEAIISANHSGLLFNYNMDGNPSKKIICNLSNSYNSWFVYFDKWVGKTSRTYSQNHTVIFTSNGEDNEPQSVYHANIAGSIEIYEPLHYKAKDATVSCYYDSDYSAKL